MCSVSAAIYGSYWIEKKSLASARYGIVCLHLAEVFISSPSCICTMVFDLWDCDEYDQCVCR